MPIRVVPGGLSAVLPRFGGAAGPLPPTIPGYAGGGAVAARMADAASAASGSRGPTLNGDINVYNPVPEPAGTSVYRAVRQLGDEDS